MDKIDVAKELAATSGPDVCEMLRIKLAAAEAQLAECQSELAAATARAEEAEKVLDDYIKMAYAFVPAVDGIAGGMDRIRKIDVEPFDVGRTDKA